MTKLKKYLAEVKEREEAATEGLSIVVNDKKDRFLSNAADQMNECLLICKQDVPKLIRMLEVAAEILNYIGNSPTRDCKEPKAREALEKLNAIAEERDS